MSTCEKCWRDAHAGGPYADVAENYARLLEKRKDKPCTPEQQAGENAGWCPKCDRKSSTNTPESAWRGAWRLREKPLKNLILRRGSCVDKMITRTRVRVKQSIPGADPGQRRKR